MLSILGRTIHFIAPSGLLYKPVRCCLYRVRQVILLRRPDFYIDRLDVIYIGLDRSFTSSSGLFYIDRVDVIYTEPDRSFSAPSELLSGPVRCCLYWAGNGHSVRHPTFLYRPARCYLYRAGQVIFCVIRAFKWTD